MTALNKYAALRQLAEESTQGEWWSDVVETDGEYGDGEDRASGYHSYAVYVGNESLLDMTNSTAACIHEEWDDEYHMAWDETAKRNAEFISVANPATVLALLDELESAEKRIAEHNFENMLLANADRDIKALRQRIAELQIARDKCFLSGLKTGWEYGIADDTEGYNREIADAQEVIYRAAGIGVKGG
ncbi:ead/Ea22-like family protein [Citrobacter freundii]|uniref:ead/Ea22-like family protein n=1 Tax=Citrobacter freundii TaxID=546 RepID=UPI0015E9AD57|nr:ead/Ea22-like family protein [Citrobacter freundii]QLU13596.1 ead/Ea22-like family protein [Citrobacter freundii]